MKDPIIVIAGKIGAGNSTVARLLAKRLGFSFYSIGNMRRMMAKERGISLAEFNRLEEKEDLTDKDVDNLQKRLGEAEGNIVVDSKLSFYFIPNAVKIYLDADLNTRARRILNDKERLSEEFTTIEDVKRQIEERMKSDAKRYKKYYGIDINKPPKYDLIINTSKIKPEKVVDDIIAFLKKKKII